MCRLFGFKSAVVSNAHRSLVAADNALAEQARAHTDGWGIGYFQGDEPFVIKSTHGAAGDSSFRRASERLSSHTLVAHVRRATVGAVEPVNVHPFRHGRWLFAHNGTLHGFDVLRPPLVDGIPADLRARVLGSTDTEVLFFHVLTALQTAGVAACGTGVGDVDTVRDGARRALEGLFELAARMGTPSPVVNFILTNGSVFLANRAGRELFLATQKLMCRDEATCPAEKVCLRAARADDRVNHLLVASEPIGDEDRWEEVPEGHLVSVGDGWRLRVAAA
jgi:glutamine amidotransferase